MKTIILLLIFLILQVSSFATNTYSLNNNIKSNIDTLANQLKYLTSNYDKNEKEISDLLRLYYDNYENIIGFEIKKDKKYLFSSSRNADAMSFFKDKAFDKALYKTSHFYTKDIINDKDEKIGELIVYFKEIIKFTSEELNYLKNKKVLKIQNDSNLPPYNFNEDGIVKGYSIDYMNLIANILAIEIKYVQGNWDDFMNMLENNEIDLMANILKSKKREERFLFTRDSYVSSPLAILTRIDHKEVHTFKELEGETVALVKGYHSYDRVKSNYPKINIYPTKNTYEMINAVSTNKADASYGLKSVLDYTINKHLFTNLKTMKNNDDKELGFYFAFNRDNYILKNIIEKAQKQISKEELNNLNLKWFKKAKVTKIQSKDYLFTKEEIDYLNKAKKIKMCVDPNYLPYEYINNEGKYVGIIANFITKLSKNSGINFELINTSSWSESLEAIKEGKCDVLPNTGQTISREKYLNFTQDYFNFSNVIATKDNKIFIDSIEKLKDKKIGVIKNYSIAERLRYRYPDFNFVTVENTLDGLKKLKDNKIYAFVDTFPSLAYNMQNSSITGIKISGKITISSSSKIAIRKDNIILQKIMNKAINSVKPHEKEELLNRWLTVIKEEKINTELLIKIVSFIVLISLLIILFIIYKSNRKLSTLNKKLEKISQTDKLTSLYNRTKLDMILEFEFKNKKRYEKPLSIIIIDIDHFKKINDTYGHLVGDKILVEFSNIIKANIRETDFIGRWGGEEFLVVLPFTKEKDAYNLASKLRKLIAKKPLYKNINVTASFGVVECKDSDCNKALLNADKALYEAKNSNRNCVKVFVD
ncbi:diguanylate cyclase [Malaciobacter marinus]|jgi:polar amino acid transport system substrate-binding protein|uniref:transporter substrate-binding domain-containing diguanylate cyclase n=1 Tax=Malaciobacter marinus TaxID=505249 RepID=UPI0009A8BFBB|nr:transporter substrate-binding domain-containing protein [Malaciobacter marinus]SKB59701.1 periplasmic/7TM domain sensor diguanylate cyclase [Malaciobacter marinus]